jgi:hypothetical protein
MEPTAEVALRHASKEERLVPFSLLYHTMMRDLTLKIETQGDVTAMHDYHHQVANVVVLAAFVTEAAINEIAYWLETRFTQPVAMPPKFDRFNIRKKWLTVPRLCGVHAFNKQTRPWTDFDALIRLRNAFAHARAFPGPPEGVLEVLEARNCVQPAVDWFESTMTKRTARWACATASAMPEALGQLLTERIDLHNGGSAWMWGKEWLHPIDTPLQCSDYLRRPLSFLSAG